MVEPGHFPTTEIVNKALASARYYGSPYQSHLDAFATALESIRPAGPPADSAMVVEAIWRAVHEAASPFYQPVGGDAERVAAVRRATSFEVFEAEVHKAIGWPAAAEKR